MKNIFQKIIFKIISSSIFSRRFLIYKKVNEEEYYVKTRKLFTRPKFIRITGQRFRAQQQIAYTVKKAKKNCVMFSIQEVENTIQQSKIFYKKPRLEFNRIYL